MPFIYRLCLCLFAVPAFASAQASTEDDGVQSDQFDCLINPAVNGLVSCLPPEDYSSREFQWDMGDGTVYVSDANQPHVYHTYSQPGEYTVTLTVKRQAAATTAQSVLSIPEPLEDAASSQLAGGDFR